MIFFTPKYPNNLVFISNYKERIRFYNIPHLKRHWAFRVTIRNLLLATQRKTGMSFSLHIARYFMNFSSSAHFWAFLFPHFWAILLILWARSLPIWFRSFTIGLVSATFSFTIIFAIISISFGLFGLPTHFGTSSSMALSALSKTLNHTPLLRALLRSSRMRRELKSII